MLVLPKTPLMDYATTLPEIPFLAIACPCGLDSLILSPVVFLIVSSKYYIVQANEKAYRNWQETFIDQHASGKKLRTSNKGYS